MLNCGRIIARGEGRGSSGGLQRLVTMAETYVTPVSAQHQNDGRNTGLKTRSSQEGFKSHLLALRLAFSRRHGSPENALLNLRTGMSSSYRTWDADAGSWVDIIDGVVDWQTPSFRPPLHVGSQRGPGRSHSQPSSHKHCATRLIRSSASQRRMGVWEPYVLAGHGETHTVFLESIVLE